jgi:AraC family transcriptional regulator
MIAEKVEVKIVSRPAFTVAGMLYRGDNSNNEIPQLWDQFGPKMGILPHRIDPQSCYGVCDNFDEEANVFDYVAACEVKAGEEMPEGMVTREIPAQTYAVFTATLPEIQASMGYIYSTWLPPSEYERGAGPEFELYGEEFSPVDPASKFYIYVPIAKS